MPLMSTLWIRFFLIIENFREDLDILIDLIVIVYKISESLLQEMPQKLPNCEEKNAKSIRLEP